MVDDDALERPFPAYYGDEHYIFISYAHKDAELVFPEIKRFYDAGYPIWYDQGLTPGQEWDDEVADALLKSSLLVIFISANSMASNNVQDEIKLALEEGIDIVPIYLEETKLPSGIRLRLSNKHAIFKHTLNDNDYIKDCFKAFDKAEIHKIEQNAGPVKIQPKRRAGKKRNVPDVFISFSSRDTEWAESICEFLEENDIKCWMGHRDIERGSYFSKEILDAINISKMVLCIFSKNAQESTYVEKEVSTAFSKNKPILTYCIDQSSPKGQMEFYLKNSEWIDRSEYFKDSYYTSLYKIKDMLKDIRHGSSLSLKKENPKLSKNDLADINRAYARKQRIYICYDERNQDIADSITGILEEYGFHCWMKSRDVGDGHVFDEIMNAIRESNLMIVIYSDKSKISNHIHTEVDWAFSHNIPFVVFKVDESQLDGGLEFFLNNKHCIDASSNYNDYLYTLVNDSYDIIKAYKSKQGFSDLVKKHKLPIIIAVTVILMVIPILVYMLIM